MYQTNSKPTYKERLLALTGYVRIAPNHVGLVYRNGRFAYFLESGWYPPLNLWDEQLVAQIPIKIHLVPISMEVLSADGFCFRLELSVCFTFNPAKSASKRRVEAATIVFSGNADSIITNRVIREAQYSAPKSIGYYTGETLLAGQIRSRLEREIRHHLQATLADLGVIIQPTGGVLIEALTPPEALTRTQNMQYQRRKTIELLEKYPEAALQAHLLESLTQQGNMIYVNRHASQGLLDHLYAAAFPNIDSHLSHAGEYQTLDLALANSFTQTNGRIKGSD